MANRQKILLILLGLTAAYYFYDLLGGDGGGGIVNTPVIKNLPVSIIQEPNAQQLVKNVTLIIPGEGNLSIDFQGTWDTEPFFKPDFLDYLNRS